MKMNIKLLCLSILLFVYSCHNNTNYVAKVKLRTLANHEMFDKNKVYDVIFDAEELQIDSLRNQSRQLFLKGVDAYKNKKHFAQAIDYFKSITLNGSRSQAVKRLKVLSDNSTSKTTNNSNDTHYQLYPYIRYGVLSVREIYHKFHKRCYDNDNNDNNNNNKPSFGISKSPIMLYLTHRDYIFNTIDDPIARPTVTTIAPDNDDNNTDNDEIIMTMANTGNIIVDCGIRQMMIQGVLDPRIKNYVYNYFKIH